MCSLSPDPVRSRAHHVIESAGESSEVDVDAAKLAELFSRLDPTYFHPHPLTAAEAARIAANTGLDIYLMHDHAYGFLRGWDKGFETPSLGLAVATDQQGHGYGRAMMEALHAAAQERGAARIRLRVHPENVRARRLYESFGYHEAGAERGEILMVLEFPPPRLPKRNRDSV
jgi:ribosomal protein S18 acetylase RimI-like enzyme